MTNTAAPHRSPITNPQDVVLHIGSGKTGTSSVQFFLQENRERLMELGWLYPQSPGRARHSRLSLFVKSGQEMQGSPEWRRLKQSDPVKFRRAFRRRLFAEIESAGLSRVLFSDEVLFGSPEPSLRRLRRFTDRIAERLRLVVYLRRQDDHMVSRYQQGVKIGWVVRLSDWAREDMSSLYDYFSRLRMWERILDPTEFVVRRYEPANFVDGSLFQDFLDAVGIDSRAADMQHIANRNDSLDVESMEFLRLLNLYRVENHAATPGLIDNRGLVPRLTEASTGPTLTLPGPLLDGFMGQWEETNRRVAHEVMGEASGILFRTPRKTRNITTEQHLDPARIDHFVTLLELPNEWSGPLHRLAEREARFG